MPSPRSSTPLPEKPPPPPSPSADAGIAPSPVDVEADHDSVPDHGEIDIFNLAPLAALKLLCDLLEALVHITGDVPPTPPVSLPSTPGLDASQKESDDQSQGGSDEKVQKRRSRPWTADDGDVPHGAKTPIGSPEARPTEPVHIEIVDAEVEPLIPQHLTVARKFYSKKPPPISLEEYLKRLHKYCPMSTAIYLATSLYIHRLAVVERLVPVTPRNVHRLVLAGLRVAMKALEDLSYPHSRFAKVGGVTEPELGRLEISFCFVTSFELRVTSEMLLEHAKVVRESPRFAQPLETFQPRLPPSKKIVGEPKQKERT